MKRKLAIAAALLAAAFLAVPSSMPRAADPTVAVKTGDPQPKAKVNAQEAPAKEQPAPAAQEATSEIDPLGPNSACFVCHMTFVREELAKVHLAEKIGCIQCHGPSEKHANDENIGATKPDIHFSRSGIDKACVQCHEDHDVPARKIVARFRERNLPLGAEPVCTDCHGRHRIDRAAGATQ